MKREILIFVCALTLFASITDSIYACCEKPVADFTATNYICIDCEVSFDASDSYDPDGTELSYDWNFGSGAYDEDVTDPVHPTCKYNTAGAKTVILEVTDNDNPDCCNGDPNCSDKKSDPNAVETVTVVRVDKVVENVSPYTNEGSLYVCLDDSVGLKAIAYPAGASFPSGEPHWTIESEPNGSNASLNPTSGSATTTLSGLTKQGEYVIKAQCGDSDTGDTITVNTPSSIGFWWDWMPDWECGEENQAFTDDDCHNWLAVFCDSTNHLSAWAYSWWYKEGSIPLPDGDRGTEVGCCVWNGGENAFAYKYSSPPGKKLFLATHQASCNDTKGSFLGEGCPFYWCYRWVYFNCVTSSADPNINWYRDEGNECPCQPWPNPKYSDSCPGPPGKHPGYPD